MSRVLALAFVLVASASTIAAAQPAPAPPPPPSYGYYPPQPPLPPPELPPEPHEGFFIHAHLGFSYTHFRNDAYDTTVSGGGAAFGVAVGHSVVGGNVIFGELSNAVASEPTIDQYGSSYQTPLGSSSAIFSLGVGLRHYFMPSNTFVGVTIGGSQLAFQYDTSVDPDYTDWGLGVSFMAGKEWMVSQNWGLGIAGQVATARMTTRNTDDEWRASAWELLFSATYN